MRADGQGTVHIALIDKVLLHIAVIDQKSCSWLMVLWRLFMRSQIGGAVVGLALALVASGVAEASEVILGPPLVFNTFGDVLVGLGFDANRNATLDGFTFQNQGLADKIVLTDGLGNILDSISTPAGVPSDAVSVDWSLKSGNEYFLLQTTLDNALFANYGSALPSNVDISIVLSGTAGGTIAAAVANLNGFSNQYWSAFNNITTSATPLPSTWTMMLLGLVGLGFVAYRGLKKDSAAIAAA
jgi:hypothetical protein